MSKKKVQESIVSDKNKTLLDRLDSFFERREKLFLWISLALGALMSFLMFDCKVSLSGDDCDYIINAENFIKHFTYPGGRGALYPIVISPFMLGGLNLLLLKSLSAIFILLSMWLMYKSFCGKIPASVLMPTLLITNICPYIYFYASYTYSEPFFMLTQSLFIYLFSKFFWNKEQPTISNIKTDWKKFLYIGLCFLSMGLTRTIGYAVLGAVILYFCFEKQWKNLLYSVSASVLVFALFSILKKIVWPDSGAAYNINNYLAKNFYGIEQGMEDLPGFIDRLVTNSHIYLSGFFYQFMGLRACTNIPLEDIPLLSVITYIVFAICIIAIYKKNRPLFFTGLYVGTMNFASFVLLQKVWAQDRLIMIYYPLMLLFVLGGVYYLLRNKRFATLSGIYPALLILLLLTTSFHAQKRVAQNIPVLQQNFLGDELYGLTPDWENFIKMSRWADENLDKDAVIVSRKPSISYIYTGRQFRGIFNVLYVNIHDIEKQYQEEKNDYTFIVTEITDNHSLLNDWDPYMQYIYITKQGGSFTINNKNIASAFVFRMEKDANTEELLQLLDAHKFNYTLDYESFFKQYIDDNGIKYQLIDPDMLLQSLTDMRVDYMLLPKIRLYTAQNTGYYMNTIHQYISFIQFKYPNRFRWVHTIGKTETCELAKFIRE